MDSQYGSVQTVHEGNEDQDGDESDENRIDKTHIASAAATAYQKHTTLAQAELRKEFTVAHDMLKDSG